MANHDQSNHEQTAVGLTGTLKLLAMLVIMALASLGALVVLDVIPVTQMGDLSIKLGLLAAIGVVAASAVWLLARSGRA